ncbi:nucleotidyl transferase AbiEii/AbiGii toxin family protein [Bifidobacterium sp. ESL0775]|uniref:nucleotidyl transferase AbiEii/AbiGii toxin family protein n=1 Tax=Bifidobacterium sp. ESL0775 TaxID=2983230 RepID=UPI0023F6CBDF|nr:nucleotidyl transferase AbiEii/AbiGii toxin family protein [Bifidobacterium sp. ESL0775]WEV69577.1 nucleotidyl transferase AbiEii/AbiGii toxin family protein [Bifidobacterium sp. ESL0775]
MTDMELTDQEIIDKALSALFSIDEIADRIALHGGQALIAYGISHRASRDIDAFCKEDTITEHEVSLIKDSLTEQFTDYGLEVRKIRRVYLPSKSKDKKLVKITVEIANQSHSMKPTRKSPIHRFGNKKGLSIEISLSNRMLLLDRIYVNGVEIIVSSLARIIYEKMLSLCENAPNYKLTHPGKGNTDQSLRAKDLFDISSILKSKHETRIQIIQTDQIIVLKTMMEDVNVGKTDFLALKQDLDDYSDQYREEYNNMSRDQVPLDERIDFADAKKSVLDALIAILNAL